MASEFIGYNVLVTLRAPPDATIQGEVANVIGQRLMLRNGESSCITIERRPLVPVAPC